MVAIYIFIGIVLTFALVLIKTKRSSRKRKKPPGPKGYPVVGCALEINENNILQKLFAYSEKYGGIFQMKLLNTNMICLNSEEVIRNALAREPCKRYMNNKMKLFISELTGESVSLFGDIQDPVYAGTRKGIIQGLHEYGQDGMNEVEVMTLNELERVNQMIASYGSNDFDVLALLRRSLTNVISLVLSGEPIDEGDKDVNMFWDYIDGINYFLNPTVNGLLSLFPVLRLAPGINRKYQYMLQGINKIRERYFYSRKDRGDDEPQGLADYMRKLKRQSLEDGQPVIFTDELILANIQETVVAGIITTWSILSSSISCLVSDQEYQDKVFKEIEEQIGRDRPPLYADKINCPHLEALELEVHRYIPVVPMLAGRFCNQDTTLEGYDVAKGTLLIVNIWYLHHNPKIWGDPWEFRPERFLDTNGKLLPKDHTLRKNLIPFGLGKRKCVGEQFARSRYFIFMASLLGRWKFVGCPGKYGKCNPKNLENIDTNITLRPKQFFCTAERRY